MDPTKCPRTRVRNLGRSGNTFFLTERDRNILHFLWKWKLASTATIHEVIGRPLSPYSTYKTLERLCRNYFIESRRTFEQNFSSWVLTDKGFETIRNSLGDLCELGYGSENCWHDLNVMAFQLGEWATNQLPIVTHFTEQELRRRSMNTYPPWVPNSKEHRPDGYTLIKTDKKEFVLAFEVEIWPKALSSYEATARFYDLMKKISRVYWLVGDPHIKELVLRAKDCIKDKSQNFHLFVDMNEYIRSGWDALVTNERSENLGSFRQTMQGLCGESYGAYLGTIGGNSRVSVHYDPRKILGKKRA